MSGPRQRLQPGGGIIVVHTRWSKKDLIGRLLDYAAKNPDADQWEYIEFPAIFNEGDEDEQSLWPEFWPLPELKKIQNTIAPHLWNAQYMQNPTTEEGALIKKEWWQDWDQEDPPSCEFTILSLDAAQESHNRADFNAVTLWGVFYMDDPDTGHKKANIILLNAWKQRMEFPALKQAMLEDWKDWQPDAFVVEKKSNGAALYQELRSMGIPVSEYTPSKGNDKISRVNAVSDIFASGLVWAPKGHRWAQEVIEECSDFPNGDHDDFVDSTTQALMRFRNGGFIRLALDYEDEPGEFRRHRGKTFYAI
jgi:predicted phage terminase large subunit-like protein